MQVACCAWSITYRGSNKAWEENRARSSEILLFLLCGRPCFRVWKTPQMKQRPYTQWSYLVMGNKKRNNRICSMLRNENLETKNKMGREESECRQELRERLLLFLCQEPCNKMTLQQKPAWSETVNHVGTWGKNISGRENSKCEVWCWSMFGEFKKILEASVDVGECIKGGVVGAVEMMERSQI